MNRRPPGGQWLAFAGRRGIAGVFFLLWTNLCSYGQLIHPAPENNWQREIRLRYKTLRHQTLRQARKQGWPLRKKYSSNRWITLQEIDSLGQPIYYSLHNTEAAAGTRTQILYTKGPLGLTVTGSSTDIAGKLGLWDGGRPRTDHQELTGRILPMNKTGDLSDHATHLAGTLIGKGINPEARGMAFGAQLLVWDYTDDLTEITAAAPTLLISNHAYGPITGWVLNEERPGTQPDLKWEWWGTPSISNTEDYLYGFYSNRARDLDRIAFNNPYYLMVRSADNKHSETGPPAGTPYYLKNTSQQSTLPRNRNDGYDVIPGEATAKNLLTIGAGDVTLTAQNQLTRLKVSAYSGWGPTDDGRIKPDLVGIGTRVLSSLTASPTAYGTYTGTSMASANVSGSLLLLQELYANRTKTANGIAQFMRSATLKGLAIHTADRPAPAKGPDYQLGWGLLNTERAAQVLVNESNTHRLDERTLPQSRTFTEQIVAKGGEPLAITLSWTDPEAPATLLSAANLNNRTPKLINDLDLRISDGRTIYLPWILDPNRPDQPAQRGDNIRDNVEQVYIANPVAGQTYTITITHKNTLTYGAQPFSLLVSGLRPSQCQFTATVSPGRDTLLCPGSTLTLRAVTNTGYQYQWLRNGSLLANAAGSALTVSESGNYVVTITDRNGCTGTSAPVSVRITTPTVTLSPAQEQWLCPNSSVTLTAITEQGTGPVPVEWLRNGQPLPGAQSGTLEAREPGRYQVRTNQQGCRTTSAEVNVRASTVNDIPLVPADEELLLPRGASVRLQAPSELSYRYQWFRNETVLPGSTAPHLLVNQPGSYQVEVTQQNCTGRSAVRLVRVAGDNSLPTGPVLSTAPTDSCLLLYPVPATATLSIRYAHPKATEVSISIYDVQGRLLHRAIPLMRHGDSFLLEMNVGTLSPGGYWIRLTDGDRRREQRFIKK
ncbi:S8 family serine peptidase [Nibrella viscosa]|uniref:S8 family serine peptidase n=1 Tax=Nibrella viscosa TaxID=1084524 RepID=UPI0031E69D37